MTESAEQHRFFNACMTLMNLDMHELVEAGIIKEGNFDNGGTSWKRFNDDPLVFLAKIDDRKRDALWKLLDARQRVKAEPDFAASIAEVIKEESANEAACGWKSCSGCHETNEGAETGFYPYSEMFGCHVGFGCSECGGLGVVWEYWSKADLDNMQADDAPLEWPLDAPQQDKAEPTPVNPAQVTDALVRAKEWISENIREGDIAGCTLLGKLAALTAATGAGGQAMDDDPVTWQWRVLESGEPRSAWKGPAEGDRAGWEALAKHQPEKYTIEKRPLFAHPAPNGQAVAEPTGFIDRHRQKFAGVEKYDADTLRKGGWTPVYAHPQPLPFKDAAESDLFAVLQDESWDLRCFNVPTGGDDADIGWRVVGHWMAEPHERVIAEVYHDDPRAAVQAALVARRAGEVPA